MDARDFQVPELDPSQDPLWHRIDAFDLDRLDPTLSFSQRLAHENGWKVPYAARVAEEYKRFCYLAVRSGHTVYPSYPVQQAWLLHLSYSRDYWDEFCADVLGADLHHTPPRAGDAEDREGHRDAYRATVRSYEQLSGERPPADIWPLGDLLFANEGAMRRVNTRHYLILRKPPRGVLWVAQIALILSTLYFLWQAQIVTALVVGALAVALAVYRDGTDNEWIAKPWRDGDDDDRSSGGGGMRGI